MAQTQVKQVIQKLVKILGYWEKENEKTPYKVRVEDCNDATIAKLVYAFDIDPNKVTPGDIYLINLAKINKGNFGTEYKIAMKDNKPELMNFVESVKIEKKAEEIEIEISDEEINAAAVQSEKEAANKKRSAKTPILSTAVNHTSAAIVKLDDSAIEFSGEGLALPPVDEILQFIERYEFVKKSIVKKSDFQVVGNKTFMKKSGFRKFIAPFRLSVQMIDRIESDRKGVVEFEVRVRVSTQTGQFCEGIGVCTQNEKNRTRTVHDTLATAYTRAVNRAISDLVAFGEVSFEEVS